MSKDSSESGEYDGEKERRRTALLSEEYCSGSLLRFEELFELYEELNRSSQLPAASYDHDRRTSLFSSNILERESTKRRKNAN